MALFFIHEFHFLLFIIDFSFTKTARILRIFRYCCVFFLCVSARVNNKKNMNQCGRMDDLSGDNPDMSHTPPMETRTPLRIYFCYYRERFMYFYFIIIAPRHNIMKQRRYERSLPHFLCRLEMNYVEKFGKNY